MHLLLNDLKANCFNSFLNIYKIT